MRCIASQYLLSHYDYIFMLKGKIMDGRGDSVASVETDRYGFGSFKFVPATEEEYQAIIAGRSYAKGLCVLHGQAKQCPFVDYISIN